MTLNHFWDQNAPIALKMNFFGKIININVMHPLASLIVQNFNKILK